MGMPSLLRKVFLIDLLQGLKVTFRYQDPKEVCTEQYPMERPQVAERYRGAPRLNVNPDTDETMCIACDLCALACPEHLIVVSSARNEQTRRKELTNFTYDLSRCMFCGLCEDACPVDALELTQDFELASYTREGGSGTARRWKKVRRQRSTESKFPVFQFLVSRERSPKLGFLRAPSRF
jgi:NADH-quinone oxidoreductase subunit I